MEGRTINVIGVGETAKQWDGKGFSIGVNDCFRYHKTDYLLVINAPNKFSPERLKFITDARPEKFLCHTVSWEKHRPKEGIEYLSMLPFTSGQIRKGFTYHSRTSPFAAMSVAHNLGAKEIILWGVDFKTHRHYYPGSGDLKAELNAYNFFIECLERNGTKVYIGCEGSELKLPVWAS